ncbi:MAG: hypothetical protein ACLFVX_04070 [Archaeoglobaceae archaeon]
MRVEDYSGSVMDVESYYRYLTATQLSKMAIYGGKMLGKQDQMLDKQDQTILTIREESRKTRETVSEESQKTRSDLKKTLEYGFDDLKQQVKTKDL